jgi:hypothetical protein
MMLTSHAAGHTIFPSSRHGIGIQREREVFHGIGSRIGGESDGHGADKDGIRGGYLLLPLAHANFVEQG